jgi:hypothetical protein
MRALGGGHALESFPLVATRPAATEGAVEREVDVFLAVHAYHEGGNVHDLLAHPAIQTPSVMSLLHSPVNPLVEPNLQIKFRK